MWLTLNELEWQDPPGILKHSDVEESQDIAEQSDAEDFDVTQLPDENWAVEVCKYFGNMIDYRRKAK